MKKRTLKRLSAALAFLLALAVLPLGALADESTTHDGLTAARDFSAKTELYVLNNTAGDSYPYYGEMYEPDGAVYYGRTIKDDNLPLDMKLQYNLGGVGPINMVESLEESAAGYYYESGFKTPDDPNYPFDLAYWSWGYEATLRDDEHIFLIYMNFTNPGDVKPTDTAEHIAGGAYDQAIIRDLRTVGSMTMPVFLRLGGEMNEWALAAPQTFIAAYRHIAALARSYAPNAALVFSPNFSSSIGVDMETFYPGDEYVDWIGVSLYFNEYALAELDKGVELSTIAQRFYGVGEDFGDPLLNVQMAANVSTLHQKPLMVTEGGAANSNTYPTLAGRDMTDFAARRIEKAMGCLPMVYPQIKCIVLSDYNMGFEDFRFYDNKTITAAFRSGVAGAGVYISDYRDLDAHKYLTPFSDRPDIAASTSGTVRLAAYTQAPETEKVTATLYIDGVPQGTSGGYPYYFDVPREKLVFGTHDVVVIFSNDDQVGYKVVDGRVTEKVAVSAEPSPWFTKEITLARATGIVPAELTHNYDSPITRRQFAALAVKFFEKMTGKEIQIREGVAFPDTDDENVLKLASIGVIGGDNGLAYPQRNITRQEAAAILVRLYSNPEAFGFPKPEPQYLATYYDMERVEDWAKWDVTRAAALSLMNGSEGWFEPDAPYTIEQSIATIGRFFNIAGFGL